MPIHRTIPYPTRLVVAVCRDVAGLSDIEAYLDGGGVADAMPYRKIFELHDAVAGLGDDDMLARGARIQAFPSVPEPMEPPAIVALADEQYEYTRHDAALAAARRPLKIFGEPHPARRWLDSLDKEPRA
ncbi:MAG: hypothetical protein JSR91_22480 [Proteobacteria bacterium]|nr:hypothetical protein [Pseudomonadota bacterium]